MDIGLIGLGKMGAKMADRWVAAGHRVVGYDVRPDAAKAIDGRVEFMASVAELLDALQAPRVVWLMLPPGQATDRGLGAVMPGLAQGDLLIDGGNSDFRETKRRGELVRAAGCRFLDVGVSGGIWGYVDGYGVTVGGDKADVEGIEPLLSALAAEGKAFHVGPAGTGHLAKMVHNAVEYAVMEAYAEGYELLLASDLDVDVPATFRAWQTGCAIRSFLLGQMVAALDANPTLGGVPPRAGDSGMGRWAIEEAVRLGVPIPAISAAVFARFRSQSAESPAMRAIAALRQQVGGHKPPEALPVGNVR